MQLPSPGIPHGKSTKSSLLRIGNWRELPIIA